MWNQMGEGRLTAGLMIILSAGGLYVAGRAAIDAIAPADGSKPGRRALCSWLPIAATALCAVLLHHPEVAVAVVFGTSVANLSLLLGLVTYLRPMQETSPRRRAWAFVLPAALLSLIAGFGGALTWEHALMLLGLGGAILAVWGDEARNRPATIPASEPATPERTSWQRWLQLVLAVGLAGVGGWAAVRGTVLAAQQAQMPGAALIAVSVLSPMLTLPALRTGVILAERGNGEDALAAVVGTVLLNLCLLLPAAVLLWYVIPGGDVASVSDAVKGMPYPWGVWRVETVALVVLGLLLAPIALGQWVLGRSESALLVLAYAVYLASVAFSEPRA
jgi:Ca2+/Na+ antiporter